MRKKIIIALICFMIALIFSLLGRKNISLEEAEAHLISKMLESESVREVFSMDGEVIYT